MWCKLVNGNPEDDVYISTNYLVPHDGKIVSIRVNGEDVELPQPIALKAGQTLSVLEDGTILRSGTKVSA